MRLINYPLRPRDCWLGRNLPPENIASPRLSISLVHFEALLVVGVGLRRGLGLVLVSHILALGQPGWVWLKVETQKLHFR